uniref:Uncharacterized protein n=1 Tax=Caenorhabditis japonica TaxID=281687 RepID=A0A8R1HS71_CAEJA
MSSANLKCDKDNEEDENEEDDGFFVPPCYLSDGEGEEDDNSDGEVTTVKKTGSRVKIDSDDEDDNEKGQDDVSDEHRKARMAQRASEWSKRTEKKKALNIIPRAIGPVYREKDAPPEFKFMKACHFY